MDERKINSEKVSVIIPVYQVEKSFLDECLTSVIRQTYENLEILLVDDGAKDDLPAYLDEWEKKDARIIVIHRENGGASAARNTGLSRASGSYVTFVDSDDSIDIHTIAEAVERLKRDRLQVLLWGSYKVYPDRKEEYMPYTADVTCFDETMKRQLMMKTMVGYLPFYLQPASRFGSGSCCSKLYDLEFLRSNALCYPVGIKRAEDVNFNIRVFDKAERIGYLNRHFYYYRQHGASATYQYRANGIGVFTDPLKCLEQFLKETNKDEEFWQVFYMRCLFFYLENLDMDILNPQNRSPWGQKRRALLEAIESEPYKSAVSKLQSGRLSFARKIPLFLLRRRWVLLLCLFYKGYGLIRK